MIARVSVFTLCGFLAATAATAQGPRPGSATVFGPPEMAPIVVSGYPRLALKRREQGTVHYRVELSRRGEPENCEVIESSGFYQLDAATCRLIGRYATFKPATRDGRPVHSSYEGRVVWQLPGA